MIRFLIKAYIILIIVDIILSYIPQLKKEAWAQTLRKIAGFTTNPVKKYLPPDLPVDISPLVVILLLNLIMFLW